jgi:hypothetical protein
MGYRFQLLLLFPRDISVISPDSDVRVWVPGSEISFGQVERFLTRDDVEHQTTGPRLAQICIASRLLSALLTDGHPKKGAPIMVSKDGSADPQGIQSCILLSPEDRTQPFGPLRPDKVQAHNGVASSKSAVKEHLENEGFNPVSSPLFLWEACGDLARWLEVEYEGTEWGILSRNKVGLAQARAWRAYLKEVASVRARALFCFN